MPTPSHQLYLRLARAAESGCISTMREILDAGYPVDEGSQGELPAICCAAQYGCVESVQFLLDAGASTGRLHYTSALHEAARDGSVACIDLLLDRGANPMLLDSDGRTAAAMMLWHFYKYRDDEKSALRLFNRFLDGGVRPSQSYGGHSLLRMAINAKAPPEFLECLADRGARITQRDKDGLEPIHAAVSASNHIAVMFLLERGIDLRDADADGKTAIHFATDPVLAKMLIDHGLEVDSRDDHGRTTLANRFLEIKKNDPVDFIAFLLAEGASLDAPDYLGVTPRQILAGRRLKSVEMTISAFAARNVMQRASRANRTVTS